MPQRRTPSRRRVLQSASALAALTLSPSIIRKAAAADADVTGRLARYMVSAHDKALPDGVMTDGKHRILDPVGAMVTGARLHPGAMAL